MHPDLDAFCHLDDLGLQTDQTYDPIKAFGPAGERPQPAVA
jgi:hypothetical protein